MGAQLYDGFCFTVIDHASTIPTSALIRQIDIAVGVDERTRVGYVSGQCSLEVIWILRIRRNTETLFTFDYSLYCVISSSI